MSVVRSALTDLMDLLSAAVAPEAVRFDAGDSQDAVPISVRLLAVDRVGRSRRSGPVLDLDVSVTVRCTGPQNVENLEKLLVAVESGSRYSTGPLGRLDPLDPAQDIGFLVHVPVSVGLTEPSAPPVREPLQVRTIVGRSLAGIVVGPDGKGIGGAYVRATAAGAAVSCDPQGRFQLLSTPEPLQQFTVEVKKTSRSYTADARTLPVVLRWD